MRFLQSESLIERCARESGWLIAERQGDLYLVRTKNGPLVRYINVRCRDKGRFIKFNTTLPVHFPIESAPASLFRTLLVRNGGLASGGWCMEVTGRCEAEFYLCYLAIKAGMSPDVFDFICRDMLKECEAFHDVLRGELSKPGVHSPAPARPRVEAHATARSLPPNGGRDIVWVEG